jgi:hypothetical protein
MKNKLMEPKFRFPLRLARHLFVAAAIFLWVGPSGAAQPSSVNGGGNGTFNADLDGDGEIDGTHFGFGVVLTPKGVVNGHFTCQMAGNMDFLGLKLMLVEGQASSAFFAPTSVTFSGTADVNFEPGGVFADIPFIVTVTAGGPRSGNATAHPDRSLRRCPRRYDTGRQQLLTASRNCIERSNLHQMTIQARRPLVSPVEVCQPLFFVRPKRLTRLGY